MSADAVGAEIPIRFSLAEAQAALQQLEGLARTSGRQVQAGFAPAATGARELKENLGRARETAMFFTSALGELGEGGRTAQVAVTGLAGAFLGGGALMVAMEGARLLAGYVADQFEEEARATKAATEAAAAHAKVLRDLNYDTEAFIRGQRGATSALEFLYGKQREFNERTRADRLRLDEIELQLFNDERLGMTSSNDLFKEREQLVGKLRIAETEWNAARASFRQREAAEEEKAATERLRAKTAEIKKSLSDLARMQNEAYGASEAANLTYRGGTDYEAERAKRFEEYRVNALRAANEAEDAEFMRYEEYKLARDQAYLEIENAQFEAAYNERLATEQRFRDLGIQAYQSLASSMGNEVKKTLSHSSAYSAAMRAAGKAAGDSADFSAAAFAKMVQDELAGVGARATVMALWEAAQALASLAIFDGRGAALHGAAAAEYSAVALAAGAGSALIGSKRGTTRAERSSIGGGDTGGGYAPTSISSGAREAGGTGGSGFAQVHTREVVVVIGDPFMTPQESAQIAARRLGLADELSLGYRPAQSGVVRNIG